MVEALFHTILLKFAGFALFCLTFYTFYFLGPEWIPSLHGMSQIDYSPKKLASQPETTYSSHY